MSKKIDRQDQWYCIHSLVDQIEATGIINSQCIWGKQKEEGVDTLRAEATEILFQHLL